MNEKQYTNVVSENIKEVEMVNSLPNVDLFKGIKKNDFGYSSSKQKNPFFELYKVATNETLSFFGKNSSY